MQEIPFTGVLLSPLGGCSARELALLKACYPQEKIYGCVWNYLQEGQDGELCEKLGNFWSVYEKLREKVTYTPIHELIGEILTKTGYGLYAGAMPGGAQRRACLLYTSTVFHKSGRRVLRVPVPSVDTWQRWIHLSLPVRWN